MHPKHEKSKSESTNEAPKELLYFAVDISKEHLDVYCAGNYQSLPNNDEGIKRLCKLVKSHRKHQAYVVYESTGWLSLQLAVALTKRGIEQICINPSWLRKWAQGMGVKAKTDKLDSEVIARYAQARELKPNVSTNEKLLRLRKLVSLYTHFSQELAKTRTVCAAHKDDEDSLALLHETIKHYEEQKKLIERKMQIMIDSDEELKSRYQFYMTLPGVGRCVAKTLIAMLPELGTFNRGQVAAMVGVAPFNKDSGQMKGQRVPRYGRKAVRCLLHQSVLSLIGCKPNIIKDYYTHLIARKVPTGKAIVACMRKLIVWINAQTREWLASRQISVESA